MKLSVKEMLSEFKAFAFKGNLIDLAVAVVIGTAFSGVIKALVDDIIMPTVSYAVTAASTAAEAGKKAAEHVGETVRVTKPSATQATTQASTTQAAATQPSTAPSVEAKPAPPPPPVIVEVKPAEKPPEKAVNFEWTIGRVKIGHFIGELINFIIIAFAVFLIVVKLLGSVMKRVGGTPPPSEPTTKECPKCLSLIPIRATKCPQCTADLPELPAVIAVEPDSGATG